MDQKITIKIAGKEYPLKAASPEMEQVMRLAADDINERLSKYGSNYSDISFEDKLVFVCLNETVSRLIAINKMKAAAEEVQTLENEIKSYLDSSK